MARKRMINPEFWNDPKILKVCREARLIFIGLISNANDYGKLRGDPSIVKSKILPTDSDISAEDVDKCAENLLYCHKIEKGVYLESSLR